MREPSRTGQPVEFYFEFASPYAYLASERIEELCARLGVPLVWRAFPMGPILKRTGARPLYGTDPRSAYTRMDCFRWARLHGIPLRHWADAPTNSLKAARGALVLEQRPTLPAYVHACYRAHFVDGRDLADEAVLTGIVAGLGEDAAAFSVAIAEPALKQRLMDRTDEAIARGVFGAPTFFFGDEMLWGNDRLPLLERLIAEHARTAGPPATAGRPESATMERP